MILVGHIQRRGRSLRQPSGKIPTFVTIEDEDHTAKCIAAIRRRRRREAMGELVLP